MKKSTTLREEKATKIEALGQLDEKAEAEKRNLTPEEKTLFYKINDEIKALEEEIRMAETLEQRNAEKATALGKHSNEEKRKKDLSKYSILKAVRAKIENKPLDGLEAEMHEEARQEMAGSGESIKGIGIPSMILEHRDNSMTMPTQPQDGSAILEKSTYGSMSDMLRNSLVTRQLGATFLNDLQGNISLTRMTGRPAASWKAEVADLDKSNVTFAQDDLAPKRLGTYIVQSLQFLRQTSPSIETKMREEILYSITEGVDAAAIIGTGASNQPLGVIANPSVPVISLGTNGLAPTRAALIAAETALGNANLAGRSLGWLINSNTKGKLKGTLVDAGSGMFLMNSNDTLMEYPVVVSNLAPSTLTKGSGTGLSAMIFGDWSELYIAQWGGIDLLVDPYTLAVGGQVKIVAQGFFNVLVHRPEAFVVIKDAVTV